MRASETHNDAKTVKPGAPVRPKPEASPRRKSVPARDAKTEKAKLQRPAAAKSAAAKPQQSASAPPDATEFLRDLGELLAGETSIVPALVQLADRQSDAPLQGVIRDLSRKVRGGSFLSDALANHPQFFSAADIAAVREGETSGTLATALKNREAPEKATANTATPDDIAGRGGGAVEPALVGVAEVADFTRELAAMIGAGVSLVRSLAALEEKQPNEGFKRVIHDINRGVQEGHCLSSALARHPRVFDKSYIETVRLGEVNGTLERMLHGLSHSDDILSFDQAVQFLGTSQPTLYRLLKQGDIKGLKVGRQWRFRKADLVAHMERRPASVTATELEGIDAELEFFAGATSREDGKSGAAQRAFNGAAGIAESSAGETKIVTLVNDIFLLALQSGASDIHLEAQREEVRLRFRLDGVLHEIRRLPSGLLGALVNRLKVMSDMAIDEKRLPQDGRFPIKWQERDFEMRVAICPTFYGESVVMRVLSQSHLLIGLDALRMEADDLARLREWLHRPNGLIFVTGPTGSGKTTTLLSCLQETNLPDRKVVTVEDPVELLLPGMMQVAVNMRVGLSFAAALRSFMRQDPDIVMAGEIRDLETAEVAAQIALTGHLMLSTLHVNAALEAPARLRDMGVEPFVIASVLTGIVAQRLARRICPDCKEAVAIEPEALRQIKRLAATGGYTVPRNAAFSRGRGCERCRQTGYRGRVPLYEMVTWSAALTEAFLRAAPREELTRIAVEEGATTMLADGIRKAVAGHTTTDEVLRVLGISL